MTCQRRVAKIFAMWPILSETETAQPRRSPSVPPQGNGTPDADDTIKEEKSALSTEEVSRETSRGYAWNARGRVAAFAPTLVHAVATVVADLDRFARWALALRFVRVFRQKQSANRELDRLERWYSRGSAIIIETNFHPRTIAQRERFDHPDIGVDQPIVRHPRSRIEGSLRDPIARGRRGERTSQTQSNDP